MQFFVMKGVTLININVMRLPFHKYCEYLRNHANISVITWKIRVITRKLVITHIFCKITRIFREITLKITHKFWEITRKIYVIMRKVCVISRKIEIFCENVAIALRIFHCSAKYSRSRNVCIMAQMFRPTCTMRKFRKILRKIHVTTQFSRYFAIFCWFRKRFA